MKHKDSSDSIAATIEHYLIGEKEVDMLPDVVRKLQRVVSKTAEAHEIVVESAVALQEKEIDTLSQSLRPVIGRDLPVRNNVNASLLGGFTIRIHDWFLDASLRSQLIDIKRRLLA